MYNRDFGSLLTQAIQTIASQESDGVLAIEDQIGDDFGYSRSTVEYWRKGNVPPPETVINLARYLLARGKLTREWAKDFLDQGGVPERDRYLTELLSELSLESPSASLNLPLPQNDLPPSAASTPSSTLFPSPIPFHWILIPEDFFWMGSDPKEDPQAKSNETPKNQVFLSHFLIAREPVTNNQYRLFIEASHYRPPPHWPKGIMPADKADHPVVQVNFLDALTFCQWAKVRLPTEAEWEKAARGIDQRLYPWGNQPPNPRLCNYGRIWGQTTPVDQFALHGASPYGVVDMAGNVWEWTSTRWGRSTQTRFPYPYDPDDGRENFKVNDHYYRLLRGGAFDSDSQSLRAACRRFSSSDYRSSNLGFRVVQPSVYDRKTLLWLTYPSLPPYS